MNDENAKFDRKSIRVLHRGDAGLQELAKDCVAFANAHGGALHIGIENDATAPPPDQKVSEKQVQNIERRIPQLTQNVGVASRRVVAQNGGEYIELQVFSSTYTIAATSDGRYYIRVSDECHPLMPDELSRLMNDKTAFIWESHRSRKIPVDHVDPEKRSTFLATIRDSDRVSPFVKDKTDEEVLRHYFLATDGRLTNLGVLWIGRREDRASLCYAPAIQCIKYDELEQKVGKWNWNDFSLNPLELIEAVWREVPDWQESHELPDGLFRTTLPHYDEVVVRELLANALVHRPYTQRGDIFVNLHPDRLEVHNPGLLPLGVTPANILHTSVKRNEHLAKVFYDLRLMEGEGTGYDRMYEVLLSSGKAPPEVVERHDRVTVTIRKRLVRPDVADFITKADQAHQLSQKERITLGLLAQHESLTALELCRKLDLGTADELRPWLARLTQWELVKTRGKTRGTEYAVDADLLRSLDYKGRTSLKGIEPHRLQELILRDLAIYRRASSTEIHGRVGEEIPIQMLRRELKKMVDSGRIGQEGAKRSTRYLCLAEEDTVSGEETEEK